MLIAQDEQGERHLAAEAVRGERHFCPECHDAVRLKAGAKRIHHFAHLPGSTCTNSGESAAHLSMKLAVWELLRKQPFVKACELEWRIGPRRADVWVQTVEGLSIAIECQRCAYEDAEITQKLEDYKAAGVLSFYLVDVEAIPACNVAFGLASLHGNEVIIPEWVDEVTLPDLTEEFLWAFDRDTGQIAAQHTFLHFWDNGRIWLARLHPVWRDEWEFEKTNRYNPIVLKKKRLLEVADLVDLRLGLTAFTDSRSTSEPRFATVQNYREILVQTKGHTEAPPLLREGWQTHQGILAAKNYRKKSQKREQWRERSRTRNVPPPTALAQPAKPKDSKTPEQKVQTDFGF
ncbi:MAG TPA: competence protein CoiA family protein [Gemmatimonadaceae bacterium]|nr:competence protein CoiA family protein [Gemmatimonadaceae bacterium]